MLDLHPEETRFFLSFFLFNIKIIATKIICHKLCGNKKNDKLCSCFCHLYSNGVYLCTVTLYVVFRKTYFVPVQPLFLKHVEFHVCVHTDTHTHTTAIEDQDILFFCFPSSSVYPYWLPENFEDHVELYIVLIGHVISLMLWPCGDGIMSVKLYDKSLFENRNIYDFCWKFVMYLYQSFCFSKQTETPKV